MSIHFGRYTFNEEAIDFIELLGSGDYVIHMARWQHTDLPRDPVVISGVDADALREYLDKEKEADRIADEMEALEQSARRASLQYQLKHPDI